MFDFSPENLDREFPVRRNLVYLNHAAVGALPRRVADAMAAHVREVSEFGAKNWRRWYALYDDVRAKAARHLGTDASRIAFLPSTSHALNLVAQALPWRTGDSVLGDDLEFPANVYPWMNLADRGVEYRIAAARGGGIEAGDFEAQADPTTRVIAVSWVAFHNGFVLPLEELGRLARRSDALFVVDAIQGLGTMPIDVERLGIDVLAADGHKFLYGAEGCAIFYVSERAKRRLGTPWVGWWNVPWKESQLEYALRPFEGARRFEPGSLPTTQIAGLSASLDLLAEIGIDTVAGRIGALTGRLRDGLAKLGWSARTPEGSPSAIVAAVPPGGDARAAATVLEQRGIIVSPREGAVRFSPHVGNDPAEIDRALSEIARL